MSDQPISGLPDAIPFDGTELFEVVQSGASKKGPLSRLLLKALAAVGVNVAGADYTIGGSQGTGTAKGGKVIIATAPAGASGSANNPLQPVAWFDADRNVIVYQALYFSSVGGTNGAALVAGGGSLRVLSNGAWTGALTSGYFGIPSNGMIRASSGSNPETGFDAGIARVGPNTWEFNGGTAGSPGNTVVNGKATATHFHAAGPSPTVTGNGSVTPTITGKDQSHSITINDATTTSAVVTFGTAFAAAPNYAGSGELSGGICCKATATTLTLTLPGGAAFPIGEVLHVVGLAF